MFKFASSFKNLTQLCEIQPHPHTLQSIRWGRKPRWMPTAKSKLFRISPRIRLPEDEKLELMRLFNNYRTEVKSLNQYFTEKYAEENVQEFDFEQHKKLVEEDFQRCTELNDKWNKEVQVTREQRVQKELEESIAIAKQRLQERKKLHADWLEKAEEIVRKEKEASKTFITPDKLDAAIEHAISNPVDYNYALDLEGQKIYGRETVSISKVEKKDQVSAEQ